MNANNDYANRNQTILFFQPRFGYIVINWEKLRWMNHEKGLLGKESESNGRRQQLNFFIVKYAN